MTETQNMPREGEKAPDFALPDQSGGTRALKDYAGKPLVIYFYPKDNTPGCTTESKDFTCLHGEFEKLGAAILGVSKDSVKSHKGFAEKYGMPFSLLSDEDGKMCEAYGVWGEKSFMGRKYMGIQRATFLIDGSGTIARTWPKVSVKGHAEEVLEAVRSLINKAG